jgi:hypothetical protein
MKLETEHMLILMICKKKKKLDMLRGHCHVQRCLVLVLIEVFGIDFFVSTYSSFASKFMIFLLGHIIYAMAF